MKLDILLEPVFSRLRIPYRDISKASPRPVSLWQSSPFAPIIREHLQILLASLKSKLGVLKYECALGYLVKMQVLFRWVSVGPEIPHF